MKKTVVVLIIIILIVIAGFLYANNRTKVSQQPEEKIYVAVEGDGKVVILNPATKKIISEIDLSVDHKGGRLLFAPHNIQVSPDTKTVWVTANASEHKDHNTGFILKAFAHGDERGMGDEADEIIVIDSATDTILKRIPVKPNIHLAHVIISPDNKFAYATAQNEGALYIINAVSFKIEQKINLPEKSEPHGLRMAPDGSVIYLAMLKSRGLGFFNFKTKKFSENFLDGAAVQSGVTPNGKKAFVSLYDKKQLAVFDTVTKSTSYISLPQSAKGPIQMYSSPDSRFVYLADQGYYYNEPISEWVYKIDLLENRVVKEIKAGEAPHGVVISSKGDFVYVTNLKSGDVSIIATDKDEEIARIPVGKEPNGISVWHRQ